MLNLKLKNVGHQAPSYLGKRAVRLLLVEDFEPLADAISAGMSKSGFAVDVAKTVEEAKEAVAVAEYDLALLDIELPDGNGLTLLRDFRNRSGLPVIMLTARGALGDRIEGLDGGADDYVVKPVEIPELIARCRAVLRRPGNRDSIVLEAGDLTLDTVHREAFCDGRVLPLSRRQINVLEALMQRKNRVLPRDVLLETTYDRDAEVTPNAVEATVSRVRRVLDEFGSDVAVKSVRGVGWMLVERAPQ